MAFEEQRQKMVDNQLLPSGVVFPPLIKAFLAIPREKFVPRQLAHIAYKDDEFVLSRARAMLRPSILGQLLQALKPSPQDRVLYLASGSGYGPAILAMCTNIVVCVDASNALIQEAQKIYDELGLKNIEVVEGSIQDGYLPLAPYDLLVISGKVRILPKNLLRQLKDGARGVTLMQTKGKASEAVVFTKEGDKLSYSVICNAYAPFLREFDENTSFKFIE